MSRALGIVRSFALAAPLLFPLFACSSAEDAEIVTSCTSSAQCPIGAACARPKGKCVPEPYPGVLGTFQCTLGDKAVDPRSATAFGTSDVVGKIDALPTPSGTGGAGSAGAPAESPGTDRIALVSRTVCYVDKGHLVIRQTDAGETLGQDSFELETIISQATYEKKSPLTGVPWPVDDVSLRKYLQYTQTSVKHGYSITGYVLFDQVPTVGKPLSGYLEIQDLQLDPDAGPQPAGGAGGAAGKSGAGGASGAAGKGGAAGAGGAGGAAGSAGASGKGGAGGASGAAGKGGGGGTSGAGGTAGKGGSSGTSGASGSSGTSGASGSSGASGASGSSGASGVSGSAGASGASGSSGASGAGGAGAAGTSGSSGGSQGGASGAAGAAGDAGSGGT